MSKTTCNSRTASHAAGTGQRKRAVLYLRVSTPGQVHTDYNPEGISIPAQREAGNRKADSLGADVVREFMEPGRTATSIDKRPTFQEMIAWVKEQKDIDYVIVYHFNRVFRNSVDAGITKRDLSKVGTRIVSTILDMGETPESAMVESIIHAVDQYQSQASGADIRYKMSQKVKNGGTVSQAKLGYRNVREPKPEGGEIRTIAVDPERAPLITQAFELFATGQYNGKQVLSRITAAGLTTRGTRRTSPKPVSLSQLYSILSDRYYLGLVTYQGEEYPGRHPQLVTPELFDRVQRVLALRGGGGTRQRQHHHWLKGLIWCGHCGKRLIVTPGRGNGGTYFYFLCRGRQTRTCDQPYLKVQDVEKAVEQHYATVRLSEQFRADVRRQLDDTLLSELSSIDTLKKRLTARLSELDTKEEHYLDLVGEPGWPKAKLQKKLAAIAGERAEIEGQLADTTSKLDAGKTFFLTALELLSDPQAFYRRGGASVKHALTKVIFSKLYLDTRDTALVSAHDLTPGLGDLIEAEHQARTYYRRSDTLSGWQDGSWDSKGWHDSRPLPEEGPALDDLSDADLLGWTLVGQGSSRGGLVELRGIEPLTFSMRTRRATNCATAPERAESSLAAAFGLLADRPTVRRLERGVELGERGVLVVDVDDHRAGVHGRGRGHRSAGGHRLLASVLLVLTVVVLVGVYVAVRAAVPVTNLRRTGGVGRGEASGSATAHLFLDADLPAEIGQVSDERANRATDGPPCARRDSECEGHGSHRGHQ